MRASDRFDISAVLDFWFEDLSSDAWFAKDDAVDAAVAARLRHMHERAAAGEFDGWAETADGALALVLLLDQVPRNLYRNDPQAFATDGKALAVARDAVDRGLDRDLDEKQRSFLYMPFQHCEDLAVQEESLSLFSERIGDEKARRFARRHHEIIARFGRFPHRNAVLGRKTTPEEAAFLEEPESSF